jgi:hypothetical protein
MGLATSSASLSQIGLTSLHGGERRWLRAGKRRTYSSKFRGVEGVPWRMRVKDGNVRGCAERGNSCHSLKSTREN